MLTSARVTEPKRGEWHTIRVVAQGPKIRAYLNDALLLNHDDKTFTGGWVGLWTKADSVTEFGNLRSPVPERGDRESQALRKLPEPRSAEPRGAGEMAKRAP